MTRLEFNNHVLQLSRRLYLVAYRFLKSREESEDAVQEVFIRLWNKREKLDEYISVEALATTTMKNYCIDQLRKIRTIAIEENINQTVFYHPGLSPDEQLEKVETAQILHDIIAGLPVFYKEIIMKREIEGLSYEEIALITNQNINTLRVNLSRARKMIRDEFKKKRYEYNGNIKTAGKVLQGRKF
jgi:RNA polymerase sigma factor (sigma-70 family)